MKIQTANFVNMIKIKQFLSGKYWENSSFKSEDFIALLKPVLHNSV